MTVSTAVQAGAVARVVGIKTAFKNLRGGRLVFLPQRVGVIAQGNTAATYTLEKKTVLSRKEAGDTFGYGSPIERIVNQLLPASGDGVGTIPVTIYPLEDDGSGVAAAGSLDATGTQTATKSYTVKINEIVAYATVLVGETADQALAKFKTAVDAVIEAPVTTGTVAAGVLPVTAKWAGASSNQIFMEVEGDAAGIVFSVTQVGSGATNPDVDDALAMIGDSWETLLINAMEYDDTVSLGKFDVYNEGRWSPLIRKPIIGAFCGYAESTSGAGTTITDARTADRTNVMIAAAGSRELPFVIAARAVARVATVANDNPPQDYAGQRLTGLVPGADGVQWDYITRNDAVTKGLGTTELVDSTIELSDTITMYHPAGETPPAYRYVVDIAKISNILFNTDLIFASDEWKGAPLLSDDTPTVNPTAKKPKDAAAEIASLIDNLALHAIISDPETAKSTIQAQINSSNPKRLDCTYTVQISGNTNIISVDFNFGFYFGG